MITKLIFLVFPIFILLMPLTPLAQPDKPVMNVEQLIEEAIQNNPEILAQKKRWELFKEKIPQASALEDPMFGFGIINLPTNFSFKDEDMTMKEFSHLPEISVPWEEETNGRNGWEGGRGCL